MAAMASLAAVAATATLASPAVSFSGLRPLRLHASFACPRLHVARSRHARSAPFVVRASQDATFDTIQGIIAEQLAVKKEDITPDSKFSDLGADSLDTVEIMMALEEEFKIQLDQEAGEKIQTVSHAVDLIKEVIATQ